VLWLHDAVFERFSCGRPGLQKYQQTCTRVRKECLPNLLCQLSRFNFISTRMMSRFLTVRKRRTEFDIAFENGGEHRSFSVQLQISGETLVDVDKKRCSRAAQLLSRNPFPRRVRLAFCRVNYVTASQAPPNISSQATAIGLRLSRLLVKVTGKETAMRFISDAIVLTTDFPFVFHRSCFSSLFRANETVAV